MILELARMVGSKPHNIAAILTKRTRNRHFDQTETLGDTASIERDIVQDQAFAVVKADAKGPLLPFHQLTRHSKGWTVRLHHVEGFCRIFAPDRLQVRVGLQLDANAKINERKRSKRLSEFSASKSSQ